MKFELLTHDGNPISKFSFGTMQWGGKANTIDSRAMYDAARLAGINFFDTAHGYTDGLSETLLGEFAKPDRDSLFIATKCASNGDCSPKKITKDFEESLSRLDMEHVDMLYLHRWSDKVPLEATYEALAKIVERGRATHIGVSNYSAWQNLHNFGRATSLLGGKNTGTTDDVHKTVVIKTKTLRVGIIRFNDPCHDNLDDSLH